MQPCPRPGMVLRNIYFCVFQAHPHYHFEHLVSGFGNHVKKKRVYPIRLKSYFSCHLLHSYWFIKQASYIFQMYMSYTQRCGCAWVFHHFRDGAKLSPFSWEKKSDQYINSEVLRCTTGKEIVTLGLLAPRSPGLKEEKDCQMQLYCWETTLVAITVSWPNLLILAVTLCFCCKCQKQAAII